VATWAEAALWGLLAGSALVLGAAIAWRARIPPRLTALVMGFGAGVLTSALAFELVAEAEELAGVGVTAAGFAAGALAYTGANLLLARRGAQHRKRSDCQPAEEEHEGSGTAIALGALLDGVPESVVLGASLLQGSGVSLTVLAAIFVSNVPEGLSSAAGMKEARRPASYVFAVWGGIALASGLAALLGHLLLGGASPGTLAAITAVAAGGILAMIADTMIPEAFARAHLFTGLATTAGFLAAFSIHYLGG
jgi:zinc transporter, ZIP family